MGRFPPGTSAEEMSAALEDARRQSRFKAAEERIKRIVDGAPPLIPPSASAWPCCCIPAWGAVMAETAERRPTGEGGGAQDGGEHVKTRITGHRIADCRWFGSPYPRTSRVIREVAAS